MSKFDLNFLGISNIARADTGSSIYMSFKIMES